MFKVQLYIIFIKREKSTHKNHIPAPSIVVHIFNLSTQRQSRQTSLNLSPVWATKQVLGQPSLYRESLPQQKPNKQNHVRVMCFSLGIYCFQFNTDIGKSWIHISCISLIPDRELKNNTITQATPSTRYSIILDRKKRYDNFQLIVC